MPSSAGEIEAGFLQRHRVIADRGGVWQGL
jgi:hypothetical protein